MIVIGGITRDGWSVRKVDPCGICGLRENDNLVLCVLCDKWIHSKYAEIN